MRRDLSSLAARTPCRMLAGPMPDMVAQILAGDRGATARAISAVEYDAPGSGQLLCALHAHIGRARVLDGQKH